MEQNSEKLRKEILDSFPDPTRPNPDGAITDTEIAKLLHYDDPVKIVTECRFMWRDGYLKKGRTTRGGTFYTLSQKGIHVRDTKYNPTWIEEIENRKKELQKSLKHLYYDLLDAETKQEKEPFGFQNRLKVIHEELDGLVYKIDAVIGLGEFGALRDFESEYNRLGESGMDQQLKSYIKQLAVEIELDLDTSSFSIPLDSSIENEEKQLELEVDDEDPTGKIRVFISHKFVESDQILAEKLRKKLNECNIYGYNASRNREYDLVFGEKIKQEINNSDYLIAIITKNSQNAPSVHQEIGYALGVRVPVRLMVEENEAKGVLVEGKDIEKFSRTKFDSNLGNIIQDILKKGIRDKTTSDEKGSEKPVFAFSLRFGGNRLNLDCQNIGNGLAKDIELTIKTKGEPSLHPELKVNRSGLGNGDHFIINNWQMHGWVGIGAYQFDCEILGSCKDIFGNTHLINEKLHFDNNPS